MTHVPGYGPLPSPFMIVGEAPGKDEAKVGRPFVGKAGQVQQLYLRKVGFEQRDFYRTNVYPIYRPNNPDPSPSEIAEYTPALLSQVEECQPSIILTVGRFSTQWFLGEDARLDWVHGVPHRAGDFDSSLDHRALSDTIILPVHHPALGFYSKQMREVVWADFLAAGDCLKLIESGQGVEFPVDEYEGREQYLDVSGRWIKDWLERTEPQILGLDTEGYLDDPESIQVSDLPGRGYVLRVERGDFDIGIKALQSAVDRGCEIVVHYAMHDIPVSRVMGLELRRATVWDTMYDPYILRSEPQGLKPFIWRWCGMAHDEFESLTKESTKEAQTDWLCEVIDAKIPKPETQLLVDNDGTLLTYNPQSPSRDAESILFDVMTGKTDKEGNPVDIEKRWNQTGGGPKGRIKAQLRSKAEEDVGRLPRRSLRRVSLDKATHYAARDADGALRAHKAVAPTLESRNLLSLRDRGRLVLPMLEEMQSHGMPVSRKMLQALADEVDDRCYRLVKKLSNRYMGGEPFNPNSSPQTRDLLRRLGLKPTKRTKTTGEWSTSKDSIEHLRFEHPAMEMLFEWREWRHLGDSFCLPILDLIPEDEDITFIRGQIKNTRTATRRLAYTDPNLLNIPSRTEKGRRVRDCYIAPEGWMLGAWDLSQIEYRVLTHLSQDSLLLEFYREGRDVHTETAIRVLGADPENVTKSERDPAKTVNYGIVYGQQASGLATTLRKQGIKGWPEARCGQTITGYYNTYLGVTEYGDRLEREVEETGIVHDHWGMPRHLPGIWGEEFDRAEAKRLAVSHQVQGTAQGMIQESMIWLTERVWELQDRGVEVYPLLQIHDELIFMFREDDWEELDELVKEGLTEHCGLELSVPVEAGGNMGKSWGELK